jgi:site-specific DNA-cytosine methylase
MKVLVACEFSGIVRDAIRANGHDAWSCDILESERPGHHIQGDVLSVVGEGWDMLIAHPPCTHLTVSGARWWRDKKKEQKQAIWFFFHLLNSPIDRIAIENPIGIMSSEYQKPDQIVQPWMFGHGETKATCLWLKGLPKLEPTNVVSGREPKIHRMAPGPDRWRNRSRTYQGIADAMADQWAPREPKGTP